MSLRVPDIERVTSRVGLVPTISFPLAWLVTLISFSLAWLVASLLIRRRTISAGRAAAATIMATGGGCLTGFIVLFSLISLQAGIEPA